VTAPGPLNPALYINIVAYLRKARTVKPADTAVARERLYKDARLLGNRFVIRTNVVSGKRCSLRCPCDSRVTQQ
jgi:hypothetical protein